MTFADQPATMPTQLADGAPLASRAALEAAMQGKHEAFRLDGLVATLGAEVARAGAAVEARARQLASESADVERLEGVSLSRLSAPSAALGSAIWSASAPSATPHPSRMTPPCAIAIASPSNSATSGAAGSPSGT